MSFKRSNSSRYVPFGSPALPLRVCAMAVIITSSPSSSLQSSLTSPQRSPVLQPVDLPTSTPPNKQSENSSTYLSVPANKPPDSTPIKHTQQTFSEFSASAILPAKGLGLALDVEMRQAFIGPLSVEAFFNDFLPLEEAPPPSISPEFADMAGATSEKQMYGCFVRSPNPLAFALFSYNNSSRSAR